MSPCRRELVLALNGTTRRMSPMTVELYVFAAISAAVFFSVYHNLALIF